MPLPGYDDLTPTLIGERLERIRAFALDGGMRDPEPNFRYISPQDVKALFMQYDSLFFSSCFSREVADCLTFAVSPRLTRAGAKVSFSRVKKGYQLSVSGLLLFQSFRGETREISVNGIVCRDRLSALQRLLEHEIIHLWELENFGTTSCKRERFKRAAHGFFGHTDVTHRLVTRDEIATTDYDLKVGDNVTFAFEGERKEGVICRITKRATVAVPDRNGIYRNRQHQACAKYYVPLSALRKKPTKGEST